MDRHEAIDDPVCVKSRTGYVVVVVDSPIMWQSKLQYETASTMEVNIISLAHRCHELFPIMDGISIMGKAIGLPVGNTTTQVSIHKETAGALVIAKSILP
ncbi:hypothetical protein ACHAXS_000388 [Conticribra weissflogii]